MKKDNLLYIEDINNAIDWILNDFVYDVSFEDFIEDRMMQDAVIREISIIGEAMNKIEDAFISKYPELPARESVSMRNVLIHNYGNVDLEKLWKTIKTDLPNLKKVVGNILENN